MNLLCKTAAEKVQWGIFQKTVYPHSTPCVKGLNIRVLLNKLHTVELTV